MAAPVATARSVPVGFMLENGFSSLITMSLDQDIELWELEVQPPGLDGGEAIEITTMHNSIYRTMAPRSLITLKPNTIVCAYDPTVYSRLLVLHLNIPQTFTITWPSDQTLAYFGYVQDVEFAPLVEGEFPQVTITIVPTNYDPVNCIEAGPVFAGTGTC